MFFFLNFFFNHVCGVVWRVGGGGGVGDREGNTCEGQRAALAVGP